MITGLLLAVSDGINNERYRDATNSFTDFLKEQYNLVDNVQNSREVMTDGSGLAGCEDGAVAGSSRQCTIIGRYISSDGDAERLTSYPVVATSDIVGLLSDPDLASASDSRVYDEMNLVVPTNVAELTREYKLSWGTRVVAPDDTVRAFNMLLLRSPLTNTISTYISTSFKSTPQVSQVIDESLATTDSAYLCVDPTGLTSSGRKTGVSVDLNGVNSSAIQFATAGECRE